MRRGRGRGTCYVWANEKAHKVLVLKTERRGHLEGQAINSGNNKMHLEDVGWEGMGYIDLGQRQVASCCQHGNEP